MREQAEPRERGEKWSAKRGQALVPVILVVLILTTLAIAFTASSNRELKATSNFNADTVRFNAARGAVNIAMSALGQISLNGYTYGIVPPLPDTDANGWTPIGGAWVKMDVIDTGALLDINSATAAQLELITVFGQNPAVADAIIDWRTPETTATSDGAKSDYYQGLNPPYNCKDAPFDTVEELMLVKGVTPGLLYGTPEGNVISAADAEADAQNAANSTTVGGSSSTPSSGGGGGGATSRQATTGTTGTTATAAATTGDTNWDDIYSQSTMPLSEMFTTMSMERNIAADGTARVNINTATVAQLTAIGLSTSLANALIRYRTPATGGAVTIGGATGARPGGGGATGARPGGGGGGAVRPGRQAQTGAMSVPLSGTTAKPGGNTGTGASTTTTNTFKTIADLLTIPGFSQTVMQQIADYVSVDSNQFHPNLININTAPQEVLALVPGMDHATVNAIMQYRQSGQAFQSLGDLFSLQGVTRQEFQNVMASLCAKSSIYRIRVKVRTAGQQGVYAATAYVEMTDNGPQLLQWRETPAVPGWAYWVPSPVLIAPTTTSTINGTTSGSVGQ
jgi:DNA uptake protein ComE-like DNA-binding protein